LNHQVIEEDRSISSSSLHFSMAQSLNASNDATLPLTQAFNPLMAQSPNDSMPVSDGYHNKQKEIRHGGSGVP
jgi:hypothetical protein